MTKRGSIEVSEVQQRRDAWFSRRRRYVRQATRGWRQLDPVDRAHLDEYPYPYYAYSVLVSCMQARMLGHEAVTVIEFGVAGGNGLVALERAAGEIGDQLGVHVDVLGFDNAEGMPPSEEPEDMIYWYRPGAFEMDTVRLRAKLSRARLFLGRVEETISEATASLRGPIGFCSLDLDYYSATTQALKVFDAPHETRLPRVLLYADDIFGWYDLNIMGASVGEERAFAEFNADHKDLRIDAVRGLRHKRPVPAMWNEKMFALHDLTHPGYDTPINPVSADQRAALLSLQ
jgi:hypothetical protein